MKRIMFGCVLTMAGTSSALATKCLAEQELWVIDNPTEVAITDVVINTSGRCAGVLSMTLDGVPTQFVLRCVGEDP